MKYKQIKTFSITVSIMKSRVFRERVKGQGNIEIIKEDLFWDIPFDLGP